MKILPIVKEYFEPLTYLRTWLTCWSLGHDWTCAAEQNIPPTKKQLEGGVAGFHDYATMYCKRCDHISTL